MNLMDECMKILERCLIDAKYNERDFVRSRINFHEAHE